MLPSLFPSRSG